MNNHLRCLCERKYPLYYCGHGCELWILIDYEMIDQGNGTVEKFSTILDKSLRDLQKTSIRINHE